MQHRIEAICETTVKGRGHERRHPVREGHQCQRRDDEEAADACWWIGGEPDARDTFGEHERPDDEAD